MLVLSALGLEPEEIARATGDTLRTVDRQLARGRKHIRNLRSQQ